MATRNLTAALQAEFQKNQLKLVALVQIEFVSATEYLWSGYGSLSWNSQTWKGLGRLAGISTITESSDISANGVSLSLSGIPTDLLNYCLSEIRPDKKVKIWFGAMDSNNAVVVDPYLAFQGFCDVPTFQDDGETCTITLTCEPRWLDRRARLWLYTDQDQQRLSPGDTGFRFLKDIDKPTYWGKNPIGYGGTSGGCFTYSVEVKTPEGLIAIGKLPRNRSFQIVNETGTHSAVLIVHEQYQGWMLQLASSRLVTIDHPMKLSHSWVDAQVKYSQCERIWFEGTVYNLHVLSENESDHHFILFNGDVAHNKIPINDGDIEGRF